jgi:ATP-binding cassette, subfamily B (MDR/TAP), member 1
MAKTMQNLTKKGLDSYASAGSVADECISNMRTVTTFSGDQKEAARYMLQLRNALRVGIKKGFATGASMGSIMLVMFGTYALAFWYGSVLITNKSINALTHEPWTGGDVVTVFFSVLMGAFGIGQCGPSLQAFTGGRGAAYKIFEV